MHMRKFIILLIIYMWGCGFLFAATAYIGDFNRDGSVDLNDMVLMASAINSEDIQKEYDLDGNGKIDDADLTILANYIIDMEFVENSGLNVGIGGWDNTGEDFGGTVQSPPRNFQDSETVFSFRMVGYDYETQRNYVTWAISGIDFPILGVVLSMELPERVKLDSSDFSDLFEGLSPVLKIWGNLKVDGNRIRFLLFDKDLNGIDEWPDPVGKIYLSETYYWDAKGLFEDCQIVGRNPKESYFKKRQESWLTSWGYEPVTSIDLYLPDNNYMECGEIITTGAYVVPYYATNQEIICHVANSSVVSAKYENYTLTVEAIAPGESEVVIESSDWPEIRRSFIVKVVAVKAQRVVIENTYLELGEGEQQTLIAKVEPDDASQEIRWESDNPDIASVDNGIVTARSDGTCVITAYTTDGSDLSATCLVNVRPIGISSLRLDVEDLSLEIGETYQFNVEIEPANASYTDLAWGVEDESVAIIDQTGFLTIVGEGETVVHVLSLYWPHEATCSIHASSALLLTFADESLCNVYSTDGILLLRDVPPKDIRTLDKGIYVVVQGSKRFKIAN